MRVAAISFALVVLLFGCDRTVPNQPAARASETQGILPPAPPRASTEKKNTWPTGKPLTLLTYNVLATPIFTKLRTKAVLELLEESHAHIIALQEVDDWFLAELVASPWVKARYHLSENEGRPFAPGGQLIMAKQPLKSVSVMVMPGRQRRTLMIAELVVGGRLMAVATTHMESFLEDGPTRATQLDGIFSFLKNADDAVLLGDLNFGDGDLPETEHLDPTYVDVWTSLLPKDPGFTWNMDENPLARIGAFAGEPDRRLDRILLRTDAWQAKSIAIIGNRSVGRRELTAERRAMIEMPGRPKPPSAKVEIDVFPSDHYGLSAVIEPR
jgi:endonuclease/exonuclease/phosphatase family metal-dependent hydrolase